MSKNLTPQDFESRLIELLERKGSRAVSLRVRMLQCRKGGCPHCPHGPYVFAKYREGKQVKTLYLGKSVPKEYRKLVHKKEQRHK